MDILFNCPVSKKVHKKLQLVAMTVQVHPLNAGFTSSNSLDARGVHLDQNQIMIL